MPTIRDVVQTLGNRAGVEVVLLVSRDGLTIAAHARDGIDPDSLAALVPDVVAACGRLGNASDRGEFGTSVAEFAQGTAVVMELSSDAILALVIGPNTNIGSLLYELKRYRSAIAALL